MKRRDDLRAKGIKLDDVEQAPHKIIAPGYNPKETPQMFIDKIKRN